MVNTNVTAATAIQGVIGINASGPEINQDFLVRVYGPEEALYNYRLHLFVDELGPVLIAVAFVLYRLWRSEARTERQLRDRR